MSTPARPRWSVGRIIATILVVSLAVLVIAVGGCFVVMWAWYR